MYTEPQSCEYTEQDVVECTLAALMEIMHGVTGEERPFGVETRFDEYVESLGEWEFIDLLDFYFRIEACFGIDLSKHEWDELFGLRTKDAAEWKQVVGPRLTFGAIAEFVAKHIKYFVIKPVSILGKPCPTATAFLAIESVVRDVLPRKKRFRPSAKIATVLSSKELWRIWVRLKWLSARPLPPLRTSLPGRVADRIILVAVGVGIWCSMMGTAAGVGAITKALSDPASSLPIWPALPLATLLLLGVYAVRGSRLDLPPQGIVTFTDLAHAMADEKNPPFIVLCA